MLTSPLTRCAVLCLLISSLIVVLQDTSAQPVIAKQVDFPYGNDLFSNSNAVRDKRATWKPGFFWTFVTSVFQQVNETKSAIDQVNRLINDQFVDERTPPPPKTTAAPNASTTEAPFRLTRREFSRILLRNLRGLVKLYEVELDLARKQSRLNQADFNKQLRISVKQELS